MILNDVMTKFKGFSAIFSMRKEDNVLTKLFFRHNEIMNGSALATAKLWGGYANYKVGAMYFEFQNLAAPGDTPAYPSFVPSDGIEYYTGLQYSPNTDFLRVPILVGPSVAGTASGELLTLYAIAPDSDVGFWGKDFTGAANSVVIGGALVATVDSVQSNDIIMCRNYPPNTKIPKTSGEQIGMSWNVEFPYPQIES